MSGREEVEEDRTTYRGGRYVDVPIRFGISVGTVGREVVGKI